MYDEELVYMVRNMLIVAMKIVAPMLIAGVVVGFAISLVQAVTSIQEQSLAFVPKVVALVLAAILLLPWILQRISEFTIEMFRLM